MADQLRAGLKSVTQKDLKRVVVAYEPIWAIGTGRPDTPKDASEMHMWIQKIIRDISIFANKNRDVPILYGGSVNAKNAGTFLRAPGVDGLLIGRASTQATEFAHIIRSA